MSSYYTFRLSFPNVDFEPTPADVSDLATNAITSILGLTDTDKFTWAYHRVNAKGQPTTPHIHVHVEDPNRVSKATIRKRVAKYSEDDPDIFGGVKGVKLYSIKDYTNEALKDEARFFRYVFKCCHIKGHDIWGDNFFDKAEGAKQRLLANDEFDREREKLLEKEKKDADKSTTYDKFLAYLEKNDIVPQTRKSVAVELVEFYVREKMACNANTMRGYVNTFLLSNKLISYDEWIEKNLM